MFRRCVLLKQHMGSQHALLRTRDIPYRICGFSWRLFRRSTNRSSTIEGTVQDSTGLLSWRSTPSCGWMSSEAGYIASLSWVGLRDHEKPHFVALPTWRNVAMFLEHNTKRVESQGAASSYAVVMCRATIDVQGRQAAVPPPVQCVRVQGHYSAAVARRWRVPLAGMGSATCACRSDRSA